MDLTDIPADAYAGEEPPPDFDGVESADSLITGGPIRERLLDIVVGLRTPTKVSTVAERADCDTETAREYLAWFDEMGMVQRHDGRPVRYERNDAYFQWRRIDTIRAEYDEQAIVEALAETIDQMEAYSTRFDATHPDEVSLIDATQRHGMSTEAAWEALSEWETLERRAPLLDAARRDDPVSGSPRIDSIAQNQTPTEPMNDEVRVSIDVTPAAETDIFRIGAADDILRILVDAHDEEFTIPELVDITGVSRSTVWRGVDLLDELGILELRTTPQRNYVSIDPDVLQKDDPILAIAQSEFHAPVRAFLELVEAEVPAVVGVVLFGSVARGEADRVSDIDLFIVVDGDRTAARRTVGSIVQDLEARRFDGDRYAFEPFVESVESAKRIGGRLREQLEGITLVNSAELQTIRQVVYANGEAD